MTRPYRFSPEGRAKTSERMKALNADPEFKAKVSKTSSERMKALHADPEFNRLAILSDRARATYDLLRRKGCSRDDAFREALKDNEVAA